MNILGISAFYHDSAAALVRDGRIMAAAQEERFSRKKHDNGFPGQAARWIFKSNNLQPGDIDAVVFYEQPFLKFRRIWGSFLGYAPSGAGLFAKVMESQLTQKLWIAAEIRRELGFKGKIIFVKHHESHAASAFYPSPFRKAAFLTVDGVGEWETTTFGVGHDNKLGFHKRINFPHSLGLLYAAFTYFTGFKVNFGEYKVMGLAPYGEPKYTRLILDKLIDLKDDGSFHLNMEYFDYVIGEKMTGPKFEQLFRRRKREPETDLTQDDMDLARSIQDVTELAVVRMARHIRKETGERNLCLAGGVALNCVANGKIVKEGIFDELWIQPAAGDAGGALGAALAYWYQHLGNERQAGTETGSSQEHTFLGPQFSEEDIKEFLEYSRIPYTYCKNIAEVTADLLAQGKIIGWFSGRMEYGPRALGARSIIGDPRNPQMQKTMNLKIKFRESFRPFAPSVLKEKTSEWFDTAHPSPFMLLVADVKHDKRKQMSAEEQGLFGIDKLNVVRSEIPAVTHVDYSARIQTVSRTANAKYHQVIEAFAAKTGCPVIINTSFNVRGEPIVCTPEDAYRCFMRTHIDYLVLENFLLEKVQQRDWQEQENWKEEFVLD